jgi:ABC-2 type transport system permease protein
VNLQHFKAFVWLRYRIRVNQFKKAGSVNFALMAILAVGALIASVGLFITGVLIGVLALPEAPPWVRLVVWDGLVVGCLFSWMIGLLTDLQRTESLALDKFLHLPVSISGAFLINYLSSLMTFTLTMFVPAMIGLAIGQMFAHGPAMLLAFPLIAASVFALTAVTYQFQGWLASLMTNPRRRRTVIVFVTMGFILVFQLPNLINIVRPWGKVEESNKWQMDRTLELNEQLNTKQITLAEHEKRRQEIQAEAAAKVLESGKQTLEKVENTAYLVNTVLPFGWLPLGATALADGFVVPALLGILGLGFIGSVSFWRAYRTTLRLYTGTFTAGSSKPVKATVHAKTPRSTKPMMVEWTLPRIPEQAAAVATAACRSLLRAPEAKMILIVPIIMVVVFGGVFLSNDITPPGWARPLMALGASIMVLISTVQLVGNQFGYDRAGFRAYVLSPVPRREILLGKNLAVAPLGFGLSVLAVLTVGCIYPMRIDHYPAAFLQLASTFLLFCLLANCLSIYAPIPMAAGSMKASSVKLGPVLLQLAFMMVFPIVLMPAVIPIGIEILVEELTEVRGIPIALTLSALVLVAVVFIYRRLLTWEGGLFAAREMKILEVVTSKSD